MSTAPSRTKYSSQAPPTRAAPGGSDYSRSRNRDWEEWDFRAGTEDAVSSTQHTRRSSRPTTVGPTDERRKSNVTFAPPAPSLAPSDSISKVKSRRPSRASQYPPVSLKSSKAPSEARSRPRASSRASSANETNNSGTTGAPLTENNLEAFNEAPPRSVPDDGYGPYPDDVKESVTRTSRRESRRYSAAELEQKTEATGRRRSTAVASQRDTSDEKSGQIPSAAVASSEWSKEQSKASAARSSRRPSAVSRPSYSQETAASRSRQAPSNASKQMTRRESTASSQRTAPTPSKVIYAAPAVAAAGTYAAEEYSSRRAAPTRSKVMYDPPHGDEAYITQDSLPERAAPTKSRIMYAAPSGTEANAEETSREVTTSQSRRQSQVQSRRPSLAASQAQRSSNSRSVYEQAQQSSNSRSVYEQAQQSAEVDVVPTSPPSRRPLQVTRASGPIAPRSAFPPQQPGRPAMPYFRERTRVEKWREPSGRMISDEMYLREGRMEPVGAS